MESQTLRIGSLLAVLGAALPAIAQVEVESSVSASSADEIFEPYDIAEDYEEDTTAFPNERARARATTCISPCVVIPPIEAEAEADAVTDYGRNEVDVYAQSWADGTNSSYHDAGTASSRWQDELTLTAQDPSPSEPMRATFRIQGGWQNLACFAFVGFLYDPATETSCTDLCCPCYSVAAFSGVSNQATPACELLSPFGGAVPSLPFGFPDFDQEDGDVDLTLTVELPLLLDRPVRFGASLGAATGAVESSSLEQGIVATVERLEVPAGVGVDSAANALGAYHVPEPGAAAGGASLAALALVRRLRLVLA